MENNDSNLKPQPTGGLKLMTVFIGVLALHVVVIGGITIYHLMGGGASDVDLVTDKTHKDVKVATDGSLTDPTASTTTPAPVATDTSSSPATTPAATPPTTATPAPDATASTDTSSSPATTTAATPVPPTTPEPATTATAPTAPVSAPATDVTSATPSGPTQTGPVITPPPSAPAPATTPAPATDMAADTEATAPATDENAPVGIPYTVKKHDSLARIAHTHHITVASLKTANNLQSDLLHIGQKLVIPGKTMTITASTEAVGPGETADSIAPVTPITPSTPAVHSGPNRTLLGDSVSITTPEKKVSSTVHDESPLAKTGSHHTYTVMKGDTLSRIAHKFHTTTHALLAANSIGDSHKLRLGQKLRIPSSEPRSATNTAPARVSQPEQPIEPRATPVEPQPTEPTGQLANSPQPTESTGQLANYLP